MDTILKGAKLAGIPVEEPIVFELVVNRNTAKTLGITIAQSIGHKTNMSNARTGKTSRAKGLDQTDWTRVSL